MTNSSSNSNPNKPQTPREKAVEAVVGKYMPLSEWCVLTGVPYTSALKIVRRAGSFLSVRFGTEYHIDPALMAQAFEQEFGRQKQINAQQKAKAQAAAADRKNLKDLRTKINSSGLKIEDVLNAAKAAKGGAGGAP